MIVLTYEPAEAVGPVLALVGKAVTFDTGGISIKPAENMDKMKYDMCGGAAVLGAFHAIARTGAPGKVIGVIPSVENMPSGAAFRPGDILTGASGLTVEITNTDAEGRLILGDALWYARQLGATHLVDIATLTGACAVALGRVASGLFGSPDTWRDTVQAAGTRGGDFLWPLPMTDDYKELLKSDIADMVNAAGTRYGGAISAALFLKAFSGDTSWAHLDIAGTAWADEAEAVPAQGTDRRRRSDPDRARAVVGELGLTMPVRRSLAKADRRLLRSRSRMRRRRCRRRPARRRRTIPPLSRRCPPVLPRARASCARLACRRRKCR